MAGTSEGNDMRTLMVTTFVSLDGVMQAPGGSDEDRDGGFEHGGWAVPHFDQQMIQLMTALTNRASALLIGLKTYDIFAATWPLAEADDPIGALASTYARDGKVEYGAMGPETGNW
jgi:dihydrofolate reductase